MKHTKKNLTKKDLKLLEKIIAWLEEKGVDPKLIDYFLGLRTDYK